MSCRYYLVLSLTSSLTRVAGYPGVNLAETRNVTLSPASTVSLSTSNVTWRRLLEWANPTNNTSTISIWGNKATLDIGRPLWDPVLNSFINYLQKLHIRS